MPALLGVSEADETLCPSEMTEADRLASWSATLVYIINREDNHRSCKGKSDMWVWKEEEEDRTSDLGLLTKAHPAKPPKWKLNPGVMTPRIKKAPRPTRKVHINTSIHMMVSTPMNIRGIFLIASSDCRLRRWRASSGENGMRGSSSSLSPRS